MIVEITCPNCSGQRTILEKICRYCNGKGIVSLVKYLKDVDKPQELENVLDYQQKMSLANQQ